MLARSVVSVRVKVVEPAGVAEVEILVKPVPPPTAIERPLPYAHP
jgi:hypothetical protein